MTNAAPEDHLRTAIALLSEEPGGDRRFRLQVTGHSMAPLLRPGDQVIAERVEGEALRRGDLVVIRRDSALVTHRLISPDQGEGWYTKGDNSLSPDPLVPAAAILGRVVAVEGERGRLDFCEPRWAALNRGLGRLGRWQAAVLGAGRRLKSWMAPGDRRNTSPGRDGAGLSRALVWTSLRLVATLFRTLTWILNRYARWRFTRHRPGR